MAILEQLAPFAQKQVGICIVPSDAAAFELRQEFLRDKTAVLGEVFLTWNHFIRNVAGGNRPVLSTDGHALMIYKLLSRAPLSYFRSPSMGVARSVAETIVALKKNLVTSNELSKMLKTRKNEKERDLLKLFDLYEEERTKKNLVDEGDVFLDAFANIRDRKGIGELEFIAFEGFHHFAPGQKAVIELLSKAGVEVTVPSGPRNDLCTPKAKIRNVILRSPFQETRFVAHEIAAAVKNGIPPDKIAVCFRKGNFRLIDILAELETVGLARKTHRLGAGLSTPVLHESLAQKLTLSLPARATMGEHSKALLQILRKVHSEAGLESIFEDDDADHVTAARSLISLSRLEFALKSLRTTSELVGFETMSREMFLSIVLAQSLSFFVSPHELSQITPVRIAYFEDGMTFEPEVLFFPDLVEGRIPASFSDRMFFAGERSMDETLSQIFPPPHELLAQESFFFDRLVSRTTREVVLSHPAIDHSGREAAASSFLDPYGEPEPVVVPLPKISDERLDNVISVERERLVGDHTHPEYHGTLVDKKVRDLIRERFTKDALTPSALELYADCPFKFFVEHVLGLRPPEEVTPEVQPKDFGTLMHAILARFYEKDFDLFKKAVDDPALIAEIEKRLDRTVKEVFEEREKLIGYAAPALKPYARQMAATLALNFIGAELEDARTLTGPLEPVEFEWSFGRTDETTLKVPIDGEKDGTVRGRVDRIDVSDDRSRFAVIDYKTGRNVGSIANSIRKGLHLQIPLYVEAVRRFLFSKALPLGGMLKAVRKPENRHGFLRKDYNGVNYSIGKRSSTLVDDDKWEEMQNAALANAARYIAAIRGADFRGEPRSCGRHCDYEDICRCNKESADNGAEEGDRLDR